MVIVVSSITFNNIFVPGNFNLTGGKTRYLFKFLNDGILTHALYCRIIVETRNLSLYQSCIIKILRIPCDHVGITNWRRC